MHQQTQSEWVSEVSEICDQTARLAGEVIKRAIVVVGLRGQLRSLQGSLTPSQSMSKGEETPTRDRGRLERRMRDLESELRRAENALGKVEGDLTKSTARALSMIEQLSMQVEAYESEAQLLGEHHSEYFGRALAGISETRTQGAEFVRELLNQLQSALEHAEATLDEAQRIVRTREWPKQDQLPLPLPMPAMAEGLSPFVGRNQRDALPHPPSLPPPRFPRPVAPALPPIGPGTKPAYGAAGPGRQWSPEGTRLRGAPYHGAIGPAVHGHDTPRAPGVPSHGAIGPQPSPGDSHAQRTEPLRPPLADSAAQHGASMEPIDLGNYPAAPDDLADAPMGEPSSPLGSDAGPMQPAVPPLPEAAPSAEPVAEPPGSWTATGSTDDSCYALLGTPFSAAGFDPGAMEPTVPSLGSLGPADGPGPQPELEGAGDIQDHPGASPSGNSA